VEINSPVVASMYAPPGTRVRPNDAGSVTMLAEQHLAAAQYKLHVSSAVCNLDNSWDALTCPRTRLRVFAAFVIKSSVASLSSVPVHIFNISSVTARNNPSVAPSHAS
jgi:hypothetical protein